MVSVDGVIRNSARHPRSTQITLPRKPQLWPCTQLVSLSVRDKVTVSSIEVLHSTYIPFADSQRTVFVCATAAVATSRTATARNVVLRIVVCPPLVGVREVGQRRRTQEGLSVVG